MNRWGYLARLSEPSTWAAFAVLASFFGAKYADPGVQSAIVNAGVAVGGTIAALLPEKGASK